VSSTDFDLDNSFAASMLARAALQPLPVEQREVFRRGWYAATGVMESMIAHGDSPEVVKRVRLIKQVLDGIIHIAFVDPVVSSKTEVRE
jgi:hypothetical protein